MKKVKLYLNSLDCPDCAEKIGLILKKQKGVNNAKVYFSTSKVVVEYEPNEINLDEIEKVIAKTGYKVKERDKG